MKFVFVALHLFLNEKKSFIMDLTGVSAVLYVSFLWANAKKMVAVIRITLWA